MSDPLVAAFAAFLSTYLIHSTLLLVGAWSLEEVFEFESVRLREHLWRAALLGGFLTAGLQTGLGLETPVVRWALGPVQKVEQLAQAEPAPDPSVRPAGSRAEPAPAPRGRLAESVERARRARLPRVASPGLAAELHQRTGAGKGWSAGARAPQEHASHAHASADHPAMPGAALPGALEFALAPLQSASTAPASAPDLAGDGGAGTVRPAEGSGRAGLPRVSAAASGAALGMVLASALAGLLALLLLAGSAWRLRRRLAGSVELESGTAAEILADLVRRGRVPGPVRLLVSPRLRSPLSSGIARPSIHVPPRALEELSRQELEAMLAHELGHVARRDPAWLTLYWLVQQTCCFQPLNRLARRRLSTSAEVLADDWAVRHTGRHLSLASCLARIAGWITERPRLLTAHMTHEQGSRSSPSESTLGRRIERLLDDERRALEPSRRWWLPLAGSVLGTLALGAPGVAAHVPAPAEATTDEPAPRLDEEPLHQPASESPESPGDPTGVQRNAFAAEPGRGSGELGDDVPAEPAGDPSEPPPASRDPRAPRAAGAARPTEPVRTPPRGVLAPPPASGAHAGDPEPGLDRELVLLDDEVSALERELGLLREDLAGLESDPALASTLERLEVHARSLSSRRDRMAALLRQVDPSAVRP